MHPKVSAFAVGFVAVIHVVIAGVELFGWMNPDIYEIFKFDSINAEKARPIVMNAGLFNGFLAAGLFWAAASGIRAWPNRAFFLSCVLIAGLFGAATLPRPEKIPVPPTLILQAIPAAVALGLAWASRPKP